jgi:threonine dehydrogenase-like Zn-dependent dehydrogenase
MHALWLENQTLSYREDVPEPIPGKGEALVRVRLAGICSTDLELVKGYYPFTGIPGHEFVGKVVDAPTDPSWIGKRVVGEINIACGECASCQRGLPRHCEKRKTLGIHAWDGVFAEKLVLPISNLHEVPAGVPDRSAVFTEPLAAAYEIIDQQLINPGDRVLVIGAGRLGQLVAQVLAALDHSPDVLVKHPKQRTLLTSRQIHSITEQELPGKKYDVVIEATGSPGGFTIARQAVRPRGILVLKSTYKGDNQVNFSSIVVDEITLVGSRCGPFKPALQLLESRKVDPQPLIEVVYPLEMGWQAFQHAASPGMLKVIIQLDE